MPQKLDILVLCQHSNWNSLSFVDVCKELELETTLTVNKS